jgi:hypothetical protein
VPKVRRSLWAEAIAFPSSTRSADSARASRSWSTARALSRPPRRLRKSAALSPTPGQSARSFFHPAAYALATGSMRGTSPESPPLPSRTMTLPLRADGGASPSSRETCSSTRAPEWNSSRPIARSRDSGRASTARRYRFCSRGPAPAATASGRLRERPSASRDGRQARRGHRANGPIPHPAGPDLSPTSAAGASAGGLQLACGQQHAQAGDAAFEFLELADVRHDGSEAEVLD